nr:uncharacterized protein LOC114824490 [Malus domestica]
MASTGNQNPPPQQQPPPSAAAASFLAASTSSSPKSKTLSSVSTAPPPRLPPPTSLGPPRSESSVLKKWAIFQNFSDWKKWALFVLYNPRLGVLILPFKDHSSSNPPLDLSSPCASFTHSQSPPLTTPLSQPHSRSLAAFGAPTVVCSTPQRLNAFALKHSLASPSTAVTAHSDSEISQLITHRRGVINASLAFSAPTVSAMSAPLIGEPTPLTKATPEASQVLASLTSSVSV